MVMSFWVVTKRMRLWIQATEISFFRRVTGLWSLTIGRNLGVELLQLCMERSQFGILLVWPPGHLLLELFWGTSSHLQRDCGRPRICWRYYISLLAWECLRVPLEELDSVAGERDASISLLDLLSPWSASDFFLLIQTHLKIVPQDTRRSFKVLYSSPQHPHEALIQASG